jgi:putative NADH-flavin reductase
MKLAIFGASGKTGQLLTQQALAAGHSLTALVRIPAKLQPSPNLRLIVGDVQNQAAVDDAILGAEAVLNVLGHTAKSPRDLQAVATRNIVSAMQRLGVKRLIALTGAGLRDPQDRPKPADQVFGFLLKTFSPAVLADARSQAIFMEASTTDWTIVRVPRLTDGPYTGTYKVGYIGPDSGIQVSRADVADFMLKQLTDTTYVHQRPMISD